MNDQILQAIDAELARLKQARNILAAVLPTSSNKTSTPRRQFSAKARKAIADGQRKRWAKVKSQKKAAAPAAS